MQSAAFEYTPRHPEQSVLYHVVAEQLETLLARQQERDRSVAPVVEYFPMSKVNDALEHLRSGKARYRIVLVNDIAKSQPATESRREPAVALSA